MEEKMRIQIKDVKHLLEQGKKIKVKTKNGDYTSITKYIDKGVIKTYLVETNSGHAIKVSAEHKFFTNAGWMKCKDIIVNKHSILTDNNDYALVTSINYIGKEKIVDITVEHPEHCYFGNGLLHHNSGKSLLAAHALASTQKDGGLGVFIDTENAVSDQFLTAIGVDLSKLLYVQLDTLEDIYAAIEEIITKVRSTPTYKDKSVTIVVDSTAAASTKVEMEADYEKDGWATTKAIVNSKAMRKLTQLIGRQRICLIFTNQLRMKLGCINPDTTKIIFRKLQTN